MIRPLLFAAVDRRIRHRSFRVLAYMTAHCLEEGEGYRLMKHSSVARALGIDRADVTHDLAALVELGYLEQGPPDGRISSYRLAARLWPGAPHGALSGVVPQSRTA